jgi:hypothetical protein
MTERKTSNNIVAGGRSTPAGVAMLVWMLGVVLLGWLLYGGPGVTSISDRVAPFREFRDSVAAFFGEPPQPDQELKP